ncbi:MAG: hypothetical protein ACRDTE_28165 [Pseudonocardiaceae bacterium]
MGRRIGGAGGGSDKGSGGGGAVAAAVLAGAIAVSGGGAGAASSAGAAALDSAAGLQRIHVNTTKAKKPASRGREGEAWSRMALKPIKNPRVRSAVQCAVHSHGQVREFFIHTPCRSLQRKLLALVDEQGNIILVSIAWVRMSSTSSAREFKELIDIYGTGDVSPLAGELLGLNGIKFTGKHYDSRKARTLVVIAETESVSGQPHPELLDSIAEVAVLLPPLS